MTVTFAPSAWKLQTIQVTRGGTCSSRVRTVPDKFSCSARAVSQVVVIGGGAAGHLAAISCARRVQQHAHILLLEGTANVLTKVGQSGGGRCNVTSAVDMDDVRAFASNYPRGRLEMLSVLSMFGSRSVIDFFEDEGVSLKTEPGGKVFPVSDSSSSVIDALSQASKQAGVQLITRARVVSLEVEKVSEGSGNVNGYHVTTDNGSSYRADFVVMATGSSRSSWSWVRNLGHRIVKPVPSLFTFGLNDSMLEGLAGVSVNDVAVQLQVDGRARRRAPGLVQRGPLLITHWGLSGPAVLSLSAFGARILFETGYKMTCVLDWVPQFSLSQKQKLLREARSGLAHKKVWLTCPFRSLIPKRLWRSFVESCNVHHSADSARIGNNDTWASASNEALNHMAQRLHACSFQIQRRGQFKEEFVTAGGIALTDINMKTFESKVSPALYFAGETLDVDGRTGGYNLQFAWSSGFIAGNSIAESILSARDT